MSEKWAKTGDLSERERTVIEFAARGLVDKEIASELEISLATVRTYWERIRVKLHANNRAHAVSLGYQHEQISRAGDELSAFILRHIRDEAIFACDEDGLILTWNSGVRELFGYEEDEWIGQNQSIFFERDEMQESRQELFEATMNGASVHDRWHVRKDGSKFWASNTVFSVDFPNSRACYTRIVRPKQPPTH